MLQKIRVQPEPTLIQLRKLTIFIILNNPIKFYNSLSKYQNLIHPIPVMPKKQIVIQVGDLRSKELVKSRFGHRAVFRLMTEARQQESTTMF